MGGDLGDVEWRAQRCDKKFNYLCRKLDYPIPPNPYHEDALNEGPRCDAHKNDAHPCRKFFNSNCISDFANYSPRNLKGSKWQF